MEGYPNDGCSVTIPLLFGNQDKLIPRPNKGTTSFFKTCFNGLNAILGIGILSVSYALASGGWLSLLLLLIIATLNFYTALLIKKCMDVDPNIRSYPDIGYQTFGKMGGITMSILMYLELYFAAAGFLILEGDNLSNLLPNTGFKLFGISVGESQGFVVIVGIIVLPTVILNNMSIHSYISAIGVLALVIVMGSIFWGAAFDGIGFKQKGEILKWNGIPTSASLFMFCYSCHPLFPTLYTSMSNQKQFCKVLLVCFVLSTATYASLAVLGYLMFGSSVQSQITLNLPTEKISSRIAICVTLINPLAKYALYLTPVVNSIETQFTSYCKKRAFSILIRTALVTSSVAIAVLVPFFASLISLVGAAISATTSMLLPCICYLKISGNYRRLDLESVIIAGTVIMGFFILVTGTYSSLTEIIQHL